MLHANLKWDFTWKETYLLSRCLGFIMMKCIVIINYIIMWGVNNFTIRQHIYFLI